jgi:hypothetical protein
MRPMGVDLEDLKREDRSEYCNWWSWRPTIELLRVSGLFDAERLELMGTNSGVEITESEARAIAQLFEERVLPTLRPGERMLLDGTVTDVPDDGTFYREPSEQWKNYSASEEWLRRFVTFCRECQGFRVM